MSNAKDKQISKLYLFALLQLNFQQPVDGFLVVKGIHGDQTNHPAQFDQVRFCTVFNTLLFGNS